MKGTPVVCKCGVCKNAEQTWGRMPSDPTGERCGDNHWPQPLPHEGKVEMSNTTKFWYVIVVREPEEECRIMYKTTSGDVAEQHCKSNPNLIYGTISEKLFSQLDDDHARYLVWNHTEDKDVGECTYEQVLQWCVHIANESEIPELRMPESEKEDRGNTESVKKTPVKRTGTKQELIEQFAAEAVELLGETPAAWATIKEGVLAKGIEQGVSETTANVYFSKWKKAYLESKNVD